MLMKHSKKILCLLTMIFLQFFFAPNVKSYEWYQYTEKGLVRKSILQKKGNFTDFTDINFKETIISKNNQQKKFPGLVSPKTILLLGDTGCRIKESKDSSEYQDCNNPKTWPFPKIVESALKENPDLVIHLGDYLYREKCTVGKVCEKMSPVTGFGWKPWEMDFFQPMNMLLKKVPIIIVRGNHEDCNRAFQGYKLLLSNESWSKDCLTYESTQILVFGKTAIVNLDTSGISDTPGEEDKDLLDRLNDINTRIEKLKVKDIWIITHKPFYGIVTYKNAFIPRNINLKNSLEKSLLKDKQLIIFSGHIHTSMIVETKFAKQIVLGNSGTQLENFRDKISKNLLESFAYQEAHLISNGFGYAVLKKNNDIWSIIFKDSEGKEIYKEELGKK